MHISHTVICIAALASHSVAVLLGDPSAPHDSPQDSNSGNYGSKVLVPKFANPVLSNTTLNITVVPERNNNTGNNAVPFPKSLKDIGVLRALPTNASKAALKFQPIVDFHDDACYNAPAINIDGGMSYGYENKPCRETDMLKPEYNNVYVRRHCSWGWCAWVYEYYFAHDYWEWLYMTFGYNDKWDSVVVWTQNNFTVDDPRSKKWEEWEVRYVSTSRSYDRFDIYKVEEVQFRGKHPKVTYQKGRMSRRFTRVWAHLKKEYKLVNKLGQWVQGSLVEFERLPDDLRSSLHERAFKDRKRDKASRMKMASDGLFSRYLKEARPFEIRSKLGLKFDPYFEDNPERPQSA